MEFVTITGIDLAKNVFQLHAAAADGSAVFRKRLSRPQFQRFMAEASGLHRGDEGLFGVALPGMGTS